jgi:hypothetical protein
VTALLGLVPQSTQRFPYILQLLALPFGLFLLTILLGVNDDPVAVTGLGLGVLLLFVVYVCIAFANRYLAEHSFAGDEEGEEVSGTDSDEH